MKKIKILSLAFLLMLSFQNMFAAAAGNGHTHTASKAKIERNAKNKVMSYVEAQKLDSSWAKAKIIEMKKKSNEWLVSFKNEKLSSKNILNVYLTTYGKVKGANYK